MNDRLGYAGFDFDTLNDELLARLQVKFAVEFNDFAVSELAIVLLDLECYGLDGLAWYVDKRAAEAYLATAQTRKAVSRLCRQLGYKMRSATSAAVDLPVSVPGTYAFAVPIPQGFLFQGPNNLIFEVARPVTFLAGETGGAATKTVPVFEGQSYSETFVSDGTANQSFALRRARDGKYVVSGTVRVQVNGTTWSESAMLTFDASNQFEVAYNDDPPSLLFGDGVAGNIPPAGTTIVAVYRASSGAAGRVERDTISAPVTPLVVNFQTVALTVGSTGGSAGGDDPESLDEARLSAAGSWKARETAITQADYVGLAGAFSDSLAGRVAVAQAYVTRSVDGDLALLEFVRQIRTTAVAPVVPTATALAVIRGRLDQIRADLAALVTELTGAAGDTAAIAADADAVVTATRQIETLAANLSTSAGSVTGHVAAVKTTLAGITVVSAMTAEQIHQTTLDALNGHLDSASASAGTLAAAGGTIGGQTAALFTAAASVRSSLATVGVDTTTPGTHLYAAEQLRADLVAQAGVPSPASAIYAQLVVIENAVVTAGTSADATIEGACDEILAHVNRILAADCKANLVTVPILSKDSAGFYVAPSISLLQALQAFLDTRKEITQTVSVVSGSAYLVPAVLQVRIGILAGSSLTLIQTAALAVCNGILRGRRFGASLYLSEITTPLSALAGVAFVNVVIAGYTLDGGTTVLADKLDASGNLIVGDPQIVTKGSVAVATEYQTPAT